MEENKKKPSFQLLALITTPKLVDKAAEMFRKGALPVQYRLNAQGTASSEIMDLLGLGSIDKCILLSVMPKTFADIMLTKLQGELKLNTVNSGIAFTIPLTGANSLVLRMLTENTEINDALNGRKDETVMTEHNHALIAAIINRGFSEDVMEAARGAGAGGGTVLHSRQMGSEEVTSFWGLSLQEEKEIVLILAETKKKVDIMREISEKCGMHSDAKGLVLSLPVDSVMGL